MKKSEHIWQRYQEEDMSAMNVRKILRILAMQKNMWKFILRDFLSLASFVIRCLNLDMLSENTQLNVNSPSSKSTEEP